MTLDELHRHAAALQAAGGPLASLGDELARIRDASEAVAILRRYQDQLQPSRALNDEELGGISAGTPAIHNNTAALAAQMKLGQLHSAMVSLVHGASIAPRGQ